jgi:ribosomal protein S18 acetylase RimI-like enzyme
MPTPVLPPALLDLHYDPPLPAKATAGMPFVQTIQLRAAGGEPVASVVWIAPEGAADGVVQLLHLQVHPDYRRQGLGLRLLDAAIQQARAYYRQRGISFRRLWALVEQKSQVIARAFLTQHGFHHTATVQNVYKKQDALIYTRTFN